MNHNRHGVKHLESAPGAWETGQAIHGKRLKRGFSPLAFAGTLSPFAAVSRPIPPFAFTLVELLVAIAITVLICAVMLQISSGTLTATKGVIQKMEAGEGARSVLDTLDSDLANMFSTQGLTVLGKEVPSTSVPTVSNSVLAFITQSRGPSGTGGPYRCISVSYQLSTTGTTAGQLSRSSQPITWTDPNLMAYPAGSTSSSNPITTSVLSQGILRFEVVLVLNDGSVVTLTPGSSSTWDLTNINGQTVANSFYGLNVQNTTQSRVREILVGIIAVDSNNYALLQSTSKLNSTIALFSTPVNTGTSTVSCSTPMALWEPVFLNGSLNTLPKPVIPALQVFQKDYSLR